MKILKLIFLLTIVINPFSGEPLIKLNKSLYQSTKDGTMYLKPGPNDFFIPLNPPPLKPDERDRYEQEEDEDELYRFLERGLRLEKGR